MVGDKQMVSIRILSVFVWFSVNFACGCVWTLSGANAQEQSVSNESAYEKSVLAWRAEHESNFLSPNGWLALIGHYWLDDGQTTFGTSTDAIVKLPRNLGFDIQGTLKIHGNSVHWTVQQGMPLTIDGKSFTETQLEIEGSKAEADCPQRVQVGDRVTMQLVRRSGRLAVRVRDSKSELLENFAGKKWFPISKNFCVRGKFVPSPVARDMEVTNIKGMKSQTQVAGRIEFELGGTKRSLEAFVDSPGVLFVVFKDQTAGKSTYGAGRFLDVPFEKGKEVVVDFNQAYNPPCAFSPHTLCPLPPQQNHLDLAIEAGERFQSR